MPPLFFCNIGWMEHYRGLERRRDSLTGGGRYPSETGEGGEVCNFLRCPDGYVYGHVESIKGKIDRKINLRALSDVPGAKWATGVDVVWTATHPTEGGRRVVGWYRNATVFRERQEWETFPSPQHRADDLWSYRIVTRAGNETALNEKARRRLRLDHGPGWMGQTQWWIPTQEHTMPFVRRVRRAIANGAPSSQRVASVKAAGTKSASSSANLVKRYMTDCEVRIPPRHTKLQDRFYAFCKRQSYSSIIPDLDCVDLRYRDDRGHLVFAEVKPCEKITARVAIRTAMGQLLDYSQLERPDRKLIVLDVKPDKLDVDLALTNQFGVAYVTGDGAKTFKVVWP